LFLRKSTVLSKHSSSCSIYALTCPRRQASLPVRISDAGRDSVAHRQSCSSRSNPCQGLDLTFFIAKGPLDHDPTRERPSNQVSNDHHAQQWTLADIDGRPLPGQARRSTGSARSDLASGRKGQEASDLHTVGRHPSVLALKDHRAFRWVARGLPRPETETHTARSDP
jgi:hypothetical protein